MQDFIIQEAVKLIDNKVSVIPVHTVNDNGDCTCNKPNCQSPGKHPIGQWSEFQKRIKTPQELINDLQFLQESNIGIVTGKISGLVVVDFDCDIQPYLDRFTELRECPPAIVQSSPGRYHAYFKYPDVSLKNATKIDGNIDIRADGGFIVTPPSRHASGHKYQWLPHHSMDERGLVDMPDEFLNFLMQSRTASVYAEKALQNERDAVLASAEGTRNQILNKAAFSLGQFVQSNALDEKTITETLTQAAQASGLDLSEIQPTISSGLKAGKANPRQMVPVENPILNLRSVPEWPDPLSLEGKRSSVPILTPDMIPEPLQKRIISVAKNMSVPLEFCTIPCLVAASSLIGSQLRIHPKQKDAWQVTPNLWGAIIAPPGWKKTPAINQMLKPLYDFTTEAFKEYEEARTVHANNVSLLEKKGAALDKKIDSLRFKDDEKSKKKFAELLKEREILDKDLDNLKEAVLRRYIVNDSTVEKLAEICRNNTNGLLIYRDELSGWIAGLEKPSQLTAKAFMLEAWNGDAPFTSDTIGRGTIHVSNLCLSVLGGIQPQKLDKLVLEPVRRGYGDDGFIQRFQLSVFPDNMTEYQFSDTPVDSDAEQQVYDIFARLRDIPENIMPVNLSSSGPTIRFDTSAQEAFNDYLIANEKRLRTGEFEDAPNFASHISKYNSLVPSLALIFYALETMAAEKPERMTAVPLWAVKLAIRWAEYLEDHARKIYGYELKPEIDPAKDLAYRINVGSVYDKMNLRDIYRKGWKNLKTADQVDLAVKELERMNWVRLENISHSGSTSKILRINPKL